MSGDRRGRQRIIRLLSRRAAAPADRAVSRHQTTTVSSLSVLINAHQATPGYPPDAELLIRQPCIMDAQKRLPCCREKARLLVQVRISHSGAADPALQRELTLVHQV